MRHGGPRTACLVLAVVLACALVACSGCGGDSGLAKKYCLAGDALYNQATKIGLQLDTIKAELLRLMVANDTPGLVAKEAAIVGIDKQINKSKATLDKALAEYRRVQGLTGVDKYKQYASMQMEAALKEQQALALGQQLASYVLGLVIAAKAGKPVNPSDSLRAVSTSVNTLDSLERDIDRIKRDARNFATDNNLF